VSAEPGAPVPERGAAAPVPERGSAATETKGSVPELGAATAVPERGAAETKGPDVEAWLAQDPDPVTRAELTALRDAAAAGDETANADLAARFAGRLAFGTAGLRAELGAGPMRMNRVVVAQAAAGLAAYLWQAAGRAAVDPEQSSAAEHGWSALPAPSVVIGYDGRHNSEVFARDSATIMAGLGVQVRLLPRHAPTPVLAFAVRHFGTSAGVMVTASHNPPRDNGYKVYLGGEDGGSQIVPPADADIAAEIARVAERPITELPRSTDFLVEGDEVFEAYVEATAAVALRLAPLAQGPDEEPVPERGAAETKSAELKVVYTAMHGVGSDTARAVFARAGLPAFIPVGLQAEPDPDFPTVAFPNPEEPGALDLAFATARRAGADLIVANDPDADRLAIAIPDSAAEAGWRRLTGNEVGLLLGWAAAEDWAARPLSEARSGATKGRATAPAASRPVLANSLVSSPALGRIAAHFGLEHVETLTGFKWISRVPRLLYGYEEALGYLVDPAKVRDKDGISAAVRFVDLVRAWRANGWSVDDRLGWIATQIGGFASGQVSIRVADLADIGRMSGRLRAQPPTELAGRAVAKASDYLDPGSPFPGNDILRYDLADGARVIVRPSGTEPKLKVYLDADTPAAIAELETAVRALLA